MAEDIAVRRRDLLGAALTLPAIALAGCSSPVGSVSVPERTRTMAEATPDGSALPDREPPRVVVARATSAVVERLGETDANLPHDDFTGFEHTAGRIGIDRDAVAYDVEIDVGGGRVVLWNADHDREAARETLLDGSYVDGGTHRGFDLFLRPPEKRARWHEYYERLSDGVATDGSVLAFAGGPSIEEPLDPLRAVLDARAGAVDRYFESDPLGERLRSAVGGDATVTTVLPRPSQSRVERSPDLTPGVAGVAREVDYRETAVAERFAYVYDRAGATAPDEIRAAYEAADWRLASPDVRSVRTDGHTVVVELRTPVERYPMR